MANSIDHCTFFVQRKKRFCKMLVKPGQTLCGEHQNTSPNLEPGDNAASAIRIVCPLDRKHTVYAHNLKKHLKKCNARQGEMKSYIQKNINCGTLESLSTLANDNCYRALTSYPKHQILLVIDKINNIYDKFVQISEKECSSLLVEKELEKPEFGEKAKKHLKQISAIVGLLDEYMMLKKKTCFIEFGAGRGLLSCWVAEATHDLESSILLIERASPKHKRDNKLARASNRIQRIRADISDMALDKLEVIKNAEHVIGLTKHLCGEATDLAIRCLLNSEVSKNKGLGAILTFCCHHRCRWISYTGKTFFEENGLSIHDFNIMSGLSSWATSGTRSVSEDKEEKAEEVTEKNTDYSFSRAEREEIGRRCKNIINWGRLKHLQQYGFQCSLHYYTGRNITLENVCIVAMKQKDNT